MSARRSHGFTLLELVVVIGVFAVFAAMAYGGLDRVMLARTRIEASLTRTEEYQKAYQRLRDDFENAAPRGVRDGDGLMKAAFVYDSFAKRIEFTRGGWMNLLNLPRATLQRVGYFLDDAKLENKKLMRRVWPVLDRAPQTESQDTALLEGVDELKWRFLDRTEVWQDGWPPPGTIVDNVNLPPAPRAVEITLRTRDWGELRWLFKLGPDLSGGPAPENGTGLNPGAGGIAPVPTQ